MNDTQLKKCNLQHCSVTAHYTCNITTRQGVIILFKEGLEGKQMVSKKVEELCEAKLLECCIVNFKANDLSFFISGMYRTSQHEVDRSLRSRVP